MRRIAKLKGKKDDNKGITLIALVITIIVLLILAAVSIATLTGENGILTKANAAKTETTIAQEKEQVQLAYMAALTKKNYNGKITVDELNNELKALNEDATAKEENNSFIVTFSKTGNSYMIDDKGNIILKNGEQGGEDIPNPPEENNGITAADIANSTDKSEYYGEIVTGYNCENGAGVNAWKIFYADENNIYLIADDYIAYNYAPKGKAGSSLSLQTTQSTDYRLNFKNIVSDYAGSSDITDERIIALNSDYFTKGYTSTSNKMKAIAYMLDTNVWSVFSSSTYADYAIGGPPIEMLIKSYNQKYNMDYKVQVNNSEGYQVSKDGGENWDIICNDMFNKNDSLYIIDSLEKCYGMWLASPSYQPPSLVTAYGYGINGSSYLGDNNIGFRPLVCLNSKIQLKKNSDGSYAIK